MTVQTAREIRTELASIRTLLAQIAAELERLDTLLQAEAAQATDHDLMAIVGLGASDSTDVSEKHDRYLGEAIAHEHLS
jgi:hypothetical protein